MAHPVLMLLDDFFEDPQSIRKELIAGEFSDFQSPIDSVVYPGIQPAPKGAEEILEHRLRNILGRDITINACFARLTTRNMPSAPHKIHSDKIMGEYSCHVYLSEDLAWHLDTGTSFWMHQTQGLRHTSETDEEQIILDQNRPTPWVKHFTAPGKFNRALIHESCLWHCAEPVGGFGQNATDGRLVLTTFFSEGRT